MKNKYLLIPISLLFVFAIASCGKTAPIESYQPGDSHLNSSENNPSTSQNTTNVSAIYLNYDSATVYVGKKFNLVVSFEPETALNKNVTWSSSDTSVATVNNGEVSALKVGTTTITATSQDGGYTATCAVAVIEKEGSGTYVPDSSDSSIYIIDNSTLSNGIYDSTSGEYTFSITQNYKQIYVNVPDIAVVLELRGVTIENGANSPIYVKDCDEIEISAKSGTTNYVKDTRVAYTEDESDQGKGAIYVENGDLKLKGAGTLNVTANYYNGIHVKDDVKVQKQTLNITAVKHGIKGNDSVTINSGTITIKCGGDGLHTENSDISNKGNQKGNITVNGGTLTIDSWGDAIAAAYNAEIHQTDSTAPTSIDVRTNKYSSYNGETIDTSDSTLYLKMNSSTYSNGNYTYAAYINNQWYAASYKGELSSAGGGPGGPGGGPGGSSRYYAYQLDRPSGATSFTLYRFSGKSVTEFSLENYNAKSDAKAFNDAYDMVTISVSSGKINFSSWSNYSSGNNNSADISAKGIKAENEINISAGTIKITTYDDAIHANNDGTLENGSSPLGNVNISGGSLELSASDDGIHADYKVNISGGSINVKNAYEGIEGNVINISGGETYVYATDDGMNATKGNETPAIKVSGGYLDVEVPGNGDTDGIDSNGSFTQTGGVVIVKGPGSASGNTFGAAALDTDGNVTLSNCTLIVFGGIEKTPSTSLTKTLVSNTVSTGSHTISFTGQSYSTTLKSSTNGCIIYSSLGSATLS